MKKLIGRLRGYLNYKDIYLKAAKFENPEYISCNISPAWPIWNT
jgi:hypothetical protein